MKCQLCGKPLKVSEATFTMTGDEISIISCLEHSQLFGTCALCQNSSECDFETNPISLPKIIQKQIQKGPMTQIIQMRNPDRIAVTCAKNCSCYNSEYECGRQFSTCGNYNQIDLKV